MQSLETLEQKLSNTKLVVFDVDGVLTNGQLYYSESGETTKVFHVRDGVGLKLLSDMGIAVAIVTAKNSVMVAKRMQELGIRHYYAGIKDKKETVTKLAKSLSISLAQTVFVGDDMVDVPAMLAVGVSMCPNDAYEYVSKGVDHVVPVGGGMGVARYVCDLILKSQNVYQKAYERSMKKEFERNRQS
ncbi:KdsC family phosphatase [Reinekea sp.]|jgi:3-deoxy-D-manno-octulosonate 8-phosphate phosphatase (KDO 8-P phosphatase)|uniref:KdsC family phosphatase n=1 Tax=Reinekea sp. TaxID=1970455 RepID=UPI003989EE87